LTTVSNNYKLKINNVEVVPHTFTNSATVTWATNADGSIYGTAAAGGAAPAYNYLRYTNQYDMSPSTTWTLVTNLSVAITNSATTSRVKVTLNIHVETTAGYAGMLRILRGGVEVWPLTDVPASTASAVNFPPSIYTHIANPNTYVFVDSPASVAAQTYTVEVRSESAGGHVYVNRSISNTTGNGYSSFVASTFMVEELK